jgi:hypothetical protein
MSQILKKFIGADQVDGSKIRLANNEALRARNAAGNGDVATWKVNASDQVEISLLPKYNYSATLYDFLTAKDKGANSGVASLDSGGKIPLAQLPASLMEFKGVWNATTNAPSLADAGTLTAAFLAVQDLTYTAVTSG